MRTAWKAIPTLSRTCAHCCSGLRVFGEGSATSAGCAEIVGIRFRSGLLAGGDRIRTIGPARAPGAVVLVHADFSASASNPDGRFVFICREGNLNVWFTHGLATGLTKDGARYRTRRGPPSTRECRAAEAMALAPTRLESVFQFRARLSNRGEGDRKVQPHPAGCASRSNYYGCASCSPTCSAAETK